jgi:RNA polymerase sigma factor (sigma-70 family)
VTKEQFKSLFNLYFDDIRRYLYYRSGDTVLSSDLAQDTFLKVWEKRMEIIPGKDTGLLYKMAGDLFLSHLRRENTGSKILNEINFESVTRTPEEEIQFAEMKNTYENAVARMPENQRIVYLMSRVEGLSYNEISIRLSLSIKAVEKRMSGALAMLRKELNT